MKITSALRKYLHWKKANPLPKEISELIKETKQNQEKIQKTLNSEDKRQLNFLTSEVHKHIQEYHNKQWNDKIAFLQTVDSSVWKIAKAQLKKVIYIRSVEMGLSSPQTLKNHNSWQSKWKQSFLPSYK